MFDWIKKLSKNSKSGAAVEAPLQTRVVKRIIPASQRVNEPEPVVETYAPPVPAPAPEEPLQAPAVTLSAPTLRAPAAINFVEEPENAEEEEPPVAPLPVIKAPVRLSFNLPTAAPAPVAVASEEEEESAPPAPAPVRLGAADRKVGIKLDAPGAANHKEIVLCVGDFLERIPAHFVDDAAAHPSQEVRFDAADLYSDMTKGRATVPLSIIAEAVPSLFRRRLSPEEDVEILLPLPKIVAQMGDLLTRHDQEQAESFEEVETPFLKAAQRDGKIHKVSGAVAPPSAVPVPLKAAPVAAAPAAPAPARPKPPALKIAGVASPSTGPKIPERRVTVRVRPLIQAMPLEQREALLGSIPEDTQVDLPLDQIEGQLASGRVFLPLATFSAALNPGLRTQFNESFVGSEVPIALSEIVKNLPTETLRLRQDQQEQEVDPNEFQTPFNTPETLPKPYERSTNVTPPLPPGATRPKSTTTTALASYTTRKLNNAGNKFPSPMHAALGTQEPLDAKKVVKLASGLPGVASLTIITGDGLSLAGNLPSFMDPEGFSAMAPQLHRKMAAHASDMKLGDLRHLSLSTDTHTVTIFTGDGMTIAVLHQNQSDLGHGVREKFVAIVDGLAKQYGPELAAAH